VFAFLIEEISLNTKFILLIRDFEEGEGGKKPKILFIIFFAGVLG